jgi:predicted nuclease of predicted toxin-antitoxin system
MRFLANKNIPLPSVIFIRESGYGINAIIVDSPGISDEEILKRAAEEKSIILTFDRGYGELIFKRKLTPPEGIIYFRFTPTTPIETAQQLLKLIEIPDLSLEKMFTTVERERIRQRRTPYND